MNAGRSLVFELSLRAGQDGIVHVQTGSSELGLLYRRLDCLVHQQRDLDRHCRAISLTLDSQSTKRLPITTDY
jgi:hypothetical protein